MQFKIVSTKTITGQVQGVAKQIYGEDASIEIIGDDDEFTIKITPANEIGMTEEEISSIDHSKEEENFKSKVTKIYKDHGRVVSYED